MRKTIRFEEQNTADLQAAGFDKVILPIGLREPRDHLPFGIDAMIAHELALAVAARIARTMALPPIWYGMSHHYRHQPMCVSVTNETNIAVYRDVLESIIHWGFRKVLVIDGTTATFCALRSPPRTSRSSTRRPASPCSAPGGPPGSPCCRRTCGGTIKAMVTAARPRPPSPWPWCPTSSIPAGPAAWSREGHACEGVLELPGADGLRCHRPRHGGDAREGRAVQDGLVDHLVAFIERKEAQGWVIPKRPA